MTREAFDGSFRLANSSAIKTTCPYCGVGCGVVALVEASGRVEVAGDPSHPANLGRLCTKGMALGDTIGLEERLLHPLQRQEGGALAPISWDSALDIAAGRLISIAESHGPDAIAFYLSGQLLTEDYYVANKLMKGFIGSANVDTNSRLCMASTVAGHRRAFGADTVPACYEDLDVADLIVLVGSNAAWCHPVLFQRMLRRKAAGAKIVVVDTRRTVTADGADLFLEIAPGGDQALFSGLLSYLAARGSLDEDYISRHTTGFEAALEAARRIAPTTAATAMAAGAAESPVAAFFDMFAATPRVVTVFSQGVNQSAQGVDKVNAILNCHLATGRIGKPGSSPFSFTGQPNAMGGREVGGLANMLAAHMGFDPESIDRVQRFWKAPRMARNEGLKALQMFEAIDRGEIRALWIAGTNPAASLPDADSVRRALGKLDLLVVSENVRSNDTIRGGAHLLLPALAWGEKNGTVTNSERRISRQRAFLPTPGEARADWAIFAEVARRMGFAGFAFASVVDVFREHAALSAFENDGRRDFDLGGLAEVSDEAYDRLAPTFWPIRAQQKEGQSRFFEQGGFFTPDGRARFVAPAIPALATETSNQYPLRLNTGRIRDQWHTMTRTGASPSLAREAPEPFVEICPSDAAKAGLSDKGFARVATALGSCILRVRVTDRQASGAIFVPIHWTDETSAQARVGALVAPIVDPVSGQPEAKATPAALSPVTFERQGFLLAREPLTAPPGVWWARVAVDGAVAYRLGSNDDEAAWRDFLREVVPDAETVGFFDQSTRLLRLAAFKGAKAELLLSLSPVMESWDEFLPLFQLESLDEAQRRAFVTGAAPGANACASEPLPVRAAKQKLRPKKRASADYAKIFRRSGLLARASDVLLEELIDSAAEFTLDPGDVLFAEGDPGDAVYLVVGGALQIYTAAPSGEELVLAALTAGELAGEHYVLRKGDGRRGASARAAETTTLLRIEGAAFLGLLAREPDLARRFSERRDAREVENLRKRSEIFRLLASLGAADPQSSVAFDAGAVIFHEGDAADAAWLILSGEASVYHEVSPDLPLARLGPGQCFGERACLDHSPRSASVKAVTSLEAIRISQENFVRLHESSSELRDIVSGLQFVYHLPQRGVALQYVGEKAGVAVIKRLYRLESGRRFLSSWIPSLQAFQLEALGLSEAVEEVRQFNWIEPGGGDDALHRGVRLSRRGDIVGFAAVGEWPELPQILEAAIDGLLFQADALRAFERTGRLEIKTPPRQDESGGQACFCLQISVDKIQSLIDAGCSSFESLREKTGCGSLCGGCEPQIQSMLGRSEWIPAVGEAQELAEGICSFVLRPTCVAPVQWKTGQFVVLSGRIGDHWVNRSYTITSAPGRPLEIAVKREPKGLFSRWLFDGVLAEKELRISPPRGESVWEPSSRPTVCFVAGIGVTPAVAILRARASHQAVGPLHIDYSGRTPASMAFIGEFEAAATANENVSIEFHFTSAGVRLCDAEIAEVVRKFPGADFFICGPELYMDQVVSALGAQGVPPDHIFEERFAHAGAPVKKLVTQANANTPIGPDALQILAQDDALAAGKELTGEERAKRERHPLDRWDEIVARSAANAFPAGIDVFLTKYHGLFYVAPAQEAYMCRLRIPGGVLHGWQMRGLADAAGSFAGGYADVTTRANLQLREIGASSAVDLLLAIQNLGLTSRGSGADNIRNITGSPTAGIDPQELIDTRPFTLKMHHYILNHRELYGLPRKFNIAFSGGGRVAVLEDTNDIGFVATRVLRAPGIEPGVYFRLLLGGATGHGSFSVETGVLVEPLECVALAGAILRVFIRRGDRTNRQKARLKHLLDEIGLQAFLDEVQAEWGAPLCRPADAEIAPDQLSDPQGHIGVHPQKQPGLNYLGVYLPGGRITGRQMRGLADICEAFGDGALRLTVWQNLLISDVPTDRLNACIAAIKELDLDIHASAFRRGLIACTGSKGCKFAATDTKTHALALAQRLEERFETELPINIHFTGCRNSCAQHYVGDIGLIGSRVDATGSPGEGYDVYVGGGAGAAHRQIARQVALRIPVAGVTPLVENLVSAWLIHRAAPSESFSTFIRRHEINQLRAFAGL